MVDAQDLNILKDVVVPLVAAAIGAGAALVAGYYAIVVPQREQRKLEAARARFAISAFFEAAHLAASTIINPGEPFGVMETVLRERISGFIDAIPKFAVQLIQVLPNAEGSDKFHLMITELDRQRHLPTLKVHEVLFAYGVAATTGLLLDTSKRNECTEILAAIIKDKHDKELAGFFRVVVDCVLPLDTRREVHGQATA
jgi:hypothetical protein